MSFCVWGLGQVLTKQVAYDSVPLEPKIAKHLSTSAQAYFRILFSRTYQKITKTCVVQYMAAGDL